MAIILPNPGDVVASAWGQRVAGDLNQIETPIWRQIPFNAGYTNHLTNHQPCQFFVWGNMVMLRGLARQTTGATISSSVNIATLPVEARPLFVTAFMCAQGQSHSSGLGVRVSLQPNGDVSCYFNVSVTWPNNTGGPFFDGIVYYTN